MYCNPHAPLGSAPPPNEEGEHEYFPKVLPPQDAYLKWDDYLSNLDQYDHGRWNSKSRSYIGSRLASNSRPGSRTGSPPSSRQ